MFQFLRRRIAPTPEHIGPVAMPRITREPVGTIEINGRQIPVRRPTDADVIALGVEGTKLWLSRGEDRPSPKQLAMAVYEPSTCAFWVDRLSVLPSPGLAELDQLITDENVHDIVRQISSAVYE
jgi:hypothetical protein